MAHRADVIQIPIQFPKAKTVLKVTDPSCGKELNQREARHMMFRPGETLYFCSKECLEKFRTCQHALKLA